MDLPREHGFWVMMPAALLSAMGHTQFALDSMIVCLAVGIVTAIAGGMLRGRIRKTSWAQLLASLALAFLVVPAELLSGLAPSVVAMHVAAWASVFVGCSFSVRACFARASKQKRFAPRLQFAALAVPAATTLGLARWGDRSAVLVALIGAIGVAAIAVWRPTPKRLKATGMAMALVVAVALGVQMLSTGLS